MTYQEQLQDPRWKELREVIINRDLQCQKCWRFEKLQVHHKVYYMDGRMAWEYPKSDLIALCDKCHKDHHPEIREGSGIDRLWGELATAVSGLRGLIRKSDGGL